MKKHTKVFAALLCCLLLGITAALSVSAQGMAGANGAGNGNGSYSAGGIGPRTGNGEGGLMDGVESAIGDVTGAVSDAADALTDDRGNGGAMEGGTNIPEDSSGVITEPMTDNNIGGTQANDTNAESTITGTATDSTENAPAEDNGGNGFVGIIVAIIIAIAVILLIIALMPRKRIE